MRHQTDLYILRKSLRWGIDNYDWARNCGSMHGHYAALSLSVIHNGESVYNNDHDNMDCMDDVHSIAFHRSINNVAVFYGDIDRIYYDACRRIDFLRVDLSRYRQATT